MVTIVFILGVLNLCLGFVLALYAEHAVVWTLSLLAPAVEAGAASDPAELPVGDPPPATPATADPSPAQSEALPAEALRLLDQRGVQPASTVEAVLWVLKFALPAYRQQLVEVQQPLRLATGVEPAQSDWSAANQDWVQQLAELSAALSQRQDEARHDDVAVPLEDLLLDHSFRLQAAAENSHPAVGTLAANCQAALAELFGQLAAVHKLQGRVDDMLAQVLRRDDRLATVSEPLRQDGASPLLSRLGLEALFAQWWADDPDRVRVLSSVLVDVDRLRQIHERFGSDVADQVLTAFGELLAGQVRKSRGFDRVARFSGQRYLLFLGDTAARNATNGAERIRQSIEATSFQIGGEKFELTASCGVAEVGPQEALPDFFQRLAAAVAAAKKAGRNRTCCDEGQGAQLAELPQYRVQGRVIEIDPPADAD